MTKKSDNPSKIPRVYKELEYADFIDFIKQGLWRNNKLLAEICSVNEDTINEWKKRPEAIAARKLSLGDALRTFKNRGDIEKRLKEQGMEFDVQPLQINIINQLKRDKDEFGI